MPSDELAVAYLHRLHRRITWTRFGRSGNSRLKRIAKRSVAPIYWYVKPVVEAGAEVKARYRAVKSAYGVGMIDQLVGCVAFTASFRACPSSYFDYRLFLKERWPLRGDYLYYDELWLLLAWLNSELGPRDAADLSDKRKFYARASRVGLPVIPVLAEFDAGVILHNRPPRELPAADLFSKPADRWHGEGARVWLRQADGSYSGDPGSRHTAAELYETLRSQSFEHPLILQPRVANHSELQPLSGKGLSTVRVVTLRDTDGAIAAALACFRMPVGSLVADNFASGGLACRVALEDGRLGLAVFKSDTRALAAHPDSDAIVAGRVLPHWSAVKQLAVAAHEEFKSLPSIGWDIAITESGPVIVEGNSEWGANVVQMTYHMPLAATPIPERLAEHLDRLAEACGLQDMRRARRPGCARYPGVLCTLSEDARQTPP